MVGKALARLADAPRPAVDHAARASDGASVAREVHVHGAVEDSSLGKGTSK